MKSKAFSFEGVDWPKIMRGALVAVVGALLTYFTAIFTETDFGVWTPLVTSGFAILANVARKWVSENQ